MKPVLIVAPFFPPESHAAVFRAHKLAKYLPEHGWKPIVLTVDTNYHFNEDPGLLAELPPEVEIVRARYVEPTLRGARMALGGQSRTFSAMKSALAAEDLAARAGDGEGIPRQSSLPRALADAAYTQVRARWLTTPDAYWTWRRPAIRAGRELVERHGIEVVLSTAMPYTAHVVGRALQQLGPRWVADFRDPAGYGRKMTSPLAHVERRQREIVRETLHHADVVTTTASSYALIFTDMFGDRTKQPIAWIPTGIDTALLPEPSTTAIDTPYLLYVGEIMPDQTETFFAILASALQRERGRHRLVVVGHELMNRSRLGPIVARYGIDDRVTFHDHMPQAEVYRLLASAKAGVLAPGHEAYWWNLHAKLVDYVGMRKPVVAVVPDPSEARSVLTRTGLGVFLDGDDETATRTLTRFLDGTLPSVEPRAAECDRFLVGEQVLSFAHVFDSLARGSHLAG